MEWKQYIIFMVANGQNCEKRRCGGAFAPIAFFYLRLFFRIETFQWVIVDSNKKNSGPISSLVQNGSGRDRAFLSPPGAAGRRGHIRRVRQDIARVLNFEKKLSGFLFASDSNSSVRTGSRLGQNAFGRRE